MRQKCLFSPLDQAGQIDRLCRALSQRHRSIFKVTSIASRKNTFVIPPKGIRCALRKQGQRAERPWRGFAAAEAEVSDCR